MSARHRRRPDQPLMTLANVALPMAGIGLIIFLAVSHPTGILIMLAVADGVLVIQAVHRLVLNLANQQPRAAEQVADRLGLIARLIGAVVLTVVAIGQVRGWMHGTFRDVTLGLLVLYLVAMPVYWFGGKRRLIALLKTWGAA